MVDIAANVTVSTAAGNDAPPELKNPDALEWVKTIPGLGKKQVATNSRRSIEDPWPVVARRYRARDLTERRDGGHRGSYRLPYSAPTSNAREAFPCQLGAVHTWHLPDLQRYGSASPIFLSGGSMGMRARMGASFWNCQTVTFCLEAKS
jgi:hypothetical protein